MTPLEIALELAAQGLPVFPCAKNKRPCIPKAEGGRGFHNASTDPEEIRRLFAFSGAVLVGIPTGPRSGIDVLDFDYRNGAADWEIANAARIPATRAHRTKSGGKHLLFRHVHGVRNLASNFAPGMDVRGEGGYVIYPPSTGYAVASDIEIGEWPDWLLEILLREPEAKNAKPVVNGHREPAGSKRIDGFIAAVLRRVSGAGDGQKHYTLRNAALSLGGIQHQANFSDDEGVQMLVGALSGKVADWKLAQQTARWGIQHGRAKPITLDDRPEYQSRHAAAPEHFDGLDTSDTALTLSADAAPPEREIVVRAGLRHRGADEGLAAMAAAGVQFFQRDKSLVRATLSKAKAADGALIEVPSIAQVTAPLIARELGRSATWFRVNKDGELIRMDPPKEIVEQVAAMSGDWPFPPLAGVTGTPTLRPDGSILSKPGYDEVTGLYLMSPPTLPFIRDKPTIEEANDALELLVTLFGEFPFAEGPSLSVALSAMLTAVLRGALAPAVPMHVVTAPQPGTGKSYLLDTIAATATGERCAVIAVSPDPAETEKRLIGAALAGFSIIALDNVNATLSGDFLAQVTERPVLQMRRLGGSDMIRMTNTFTLFANGNNIAATADMVRRTLRCSLDSNLESPEKRVFVADPVAAVLADRGKYVGACLTIARCYLGQGSPDRCTRLPSFSAWSDLVRSSLVWLGQPDPVSSMDLARADDPTRQAKLAFFEAWATEIGVGEAGYKVSELVDFASDFHDSKYSYPEFRLAALAVARDKTGNSVDAAKLGNWLRTLKNTRMDDFKLVQGGADASRPRWSMVRL